METTILVTSLLCGLGSIGCSIYYSSRVKQILAKIDAEREFRMSQQRLIDELSHELLRVKPIHPKASEPQRPRIRAARSMSQAQDMAEAEVRSE